MNTLVVTARPAPYPHVAFWGGPIECTYHLETDGGVVAYHGGVTFVPPGHTLQVDFDDAFRLDDGTRASIGDFRVVVDGAHMVEVVGGAAAETAEDGSRRRRVRLHYPGGEKGK